MSYESLSLRELIDLMDDRQQQLFACDCAERVLHLFDAEYPGDDRPRRAVEIARQYADGKAAAEELEAVREAVAAAREFARVDARDAAAVSGFIAGAGARAARDVAAAADSSAGGLALHAATYAARAAAWREPPEPGSFVGYNTAIERAEREWQKQCAIGYLPEAGSSKTEGV